MESKWITNRSAYEEYVTRCQMARYLKYHYGGIGITGKKDTFHLDVGTAVHAGIMEIMKRIQKNWSLKDEYIEVGVEAGLDDYKKTIDLSQSKGSEAGTNKGDDIWTTYYQKTAKVLIEGLIRCWGMVEAPVIASRYKIVSVENDRRIRLTHDIDLEYKVDAVLIEKDSGDGVVYSIKTMGKTEYRQEKSQVIAMQNFTEVWGAMNEVKRLNNQAVLWKIRYVNLIKGANTWNKELKRKEVDGYLVRGWKKKEGSKARGAQYVAEMVQWGEGEGKRLYAGAYEKFEVSRLKGGVKRWIELLLSGRVEPGERVLEYIIQVPEMLVIYEHDLISAMRQFVAGEREVRDKLEKVKSKGMDDIAKEFRRNYRGCYYPWKCEFTEICWGELAVQQDPLGTRPELFQIRIPHHNTQEEGK